jgi:hypothetical protein
MTCLASLLLDKLLFFSFLYFFWFKYILSKILSFFSGSGYGGRIVIGSLGDLSNSLVKPPPLIEALNTNVTSKPLNFAMGHKYNPSLSPPTSIPPEIEASPSRLASPSTSAVTT